jgi:hypothetical protein
MALTIEMKTPDEPHPAALLSALVEIGKLPNFVGAMADGVKPWDALCLLEADMLAFESKNRWCGATDGWRIVVGSCPFLPDDPDYNDWGQVSSWVAYGDYVMTIVPGGSCDEDECSCGDGCVEECGGKVVLWDAEEFYVGQEATVRAHTAFADDSAIPLNRILKMFASLES